MCPPRRPLCAQFDLCCPHFALLGVWLASAFAPASRADVPPGFVDQVVVAGWNRTVGVTFGRWWRNAFVWEKGGRVWPWSTRC